MHIPLSEGLDIHQMKAKRNPTQIIDDNLSLMRCDDMLHVLFALQLIPPKNSGFLYWEDVEYFCYVAWPKVCGEDRRIRHVHI